MTGTLRAVSEYGRQRATEAMTRLIERIADAHEMEATLHVEAGYPVTVNTEDGAAFALRVANGLLGADAAHTMATPVMGAEDFSYVLQQRTGALAFLGACPPGENPIRAHACHSNRMVIDENAMRAGTAMYTALALEYLASANR
jgi:hippurate hydrolase